MLRARLLAAAALLAGGVFYPVFRATEKYRQSKLEELEDARALRASYKAMLLYADQIRSENSELKKDIMKVLPLETLFLFSRADIRLVVSN